MRKMQEYLGVKSILSFLFVMDSDNMDMWEASEQDGTLYSWEKIADVLWPRKKFAEEVCDILLLQS